MKARRVIRATISIKYDGKYSCSVCNKNLELVDVEQTDWTCKQCGNNLVIFSEKLGKYIVRKEAFLVETGDLVIDYDTEKPVQILGITELENELVMLGLKGIGSHIIPKNELIDVKF